MDFLASAALHRHGADEGETEPSRELLEEETVFMLELPTLSVGDSLQRAIQLNLRSDPDVHKPIGVAQVAQAVVKGKELLMGNGAERSRPACGHEGWVKGHATTVFPIIGWLPAATKASLKADIIAGLTVGVMAVPQSMAYASIAGLEVVYGLYAATIPAIVYATIGGSGQLAFGPVALLSLLVQAGLANTLTKKDCPDFYDDAHGHRRLAAATLADTCPKEYAHLVMFGGAICQLGFMVNFLGHPVISGFTSGAAITIGVSQLKYWFAVTVTLNCLATEIKAGNAKPMNLFLGLALALKYPKKLGWLKPLGPLIICVGSTALIVYAPWLVTDYKGLPPFSLPIIVKGVGSQAASVFPTALSSIAIGKTLAAKHNYELNAGREMTANGICNIVGSCFSGYPVAGSFSRSAVNNATGALTPLAGLVTGFFVLFCLLVIPPFVLASIVIQSVVNLIEFGEAYKLYKVRKWDFGLWLCAFLGVLFQGVEIGLAIAVGSVRPQISVLWKLPGTAIYRNVKQGESMGQFIRGVLVLRVGASMYFANVAYIKDAITRLANEFGACLEGSVQYIVVEMTPVMTLDSTAIHMLEDLAKDLRNKGIRVCFASIGSRVEEMMRRAELQKHLGYEWFHENVSSAVEWCIRHQAATIALRRRDQLDQGGDDDGGDGDGDVEANPQGVEIREANVISDGAGPRRRKNGSFDAKVPDSKADPLLPVLMLASKHRVVDRDFGTHEAPVKTPEQRAMESLGEEGSAALLRMTQSESNLRSSEEKSLEEKSLEASPASERARYAQLASLRLRARGLSEMGAVSTPLAPLEVVALPDERDPTLFLVIAIDAPDRPGLMRDITDVLLRHFQFQLRHSEAAVVSSRSISIWRCEVADRGAERVAAAAAKAESLLPSLLRK
ncbi:sulfate transporter family-domain-containing protein [Pelagophyceae sp. CCMP2097]|nr:sulfate transporter family-domain-containing protein [Pelagophyceae sp. CCMP2097]